MQKGSWVHLTFYFFFFAVIQGCGGGGGDSNPTSASTVESIYLSTTAVKLGGTTNSSKVTLFEKHTSGVNIDVSSNATWSSANNAIATVSDSGLITKVAGGVTTVTATYNGADYSIAVTVAEDALVLSVNGAPNQLWQEVAAANSTGFDPLATSYLDYTGIDYDGYGTNHLVLKFGKNFDTSTGEFANRLTIKIPSWNSSFAARNYTQRQNITFEYVGPEGHFASDFGQKTTISANITQYAATEGSLIEGSIDATLCKAAVLAVNGDCTQPSNMITLSGMFSATVAQAVNFRNEGTLANPVSLAFPFDPYHAMVQLGGTSYYKITGLTPGDSYGVIFSASTWPEFYVYADPGMTTLLCGPRGWDSRCDVKPTDTALYVKATARYDSIHEGLLGGVFTLSAAHLPAEGQQSTPKVLDYTQIPYRGSVDHTASYYRVDGLEIGKEYTVRLDGDYYDSGIDVYDDSGFTNRLCQHLGSTNSPVYCLTPALTTTSLYIKVDHSYLVSYTRNYGTVSATQGGNFTLDIFKTFLPEGNMEHVDITSQLPYTGSVASYDLYRESKYVVNNLVIGMPYRVTVRADRYGASWTLASDPSGYSQVSCALHIDYGSECIIFPMIPSLYINVRPSSPNFYGASTLIDVTPLALTPVTDSLPMQVQVDSSLHFYVVEGLTPGQTYNAVFSNIAVETVVDIDSTDFSTRYCTDTVFDDDYDLVCQFTPTEDRVYVKLNPYWGHQAGTAMFESVVPALP